MKNIYDIVIVGSGIGGLSTLLYLTESEIYKRGDLSICLIAKDSLATTNTNWAQGGIAAVHALGDNYEKHIQETLIAGANTNNNFIVEKVIKAAPDLINDLMRWGTEFDKKMNGTADLAKEGGHSEARIWHQADQTGQAIQSALMAKLSGLHNIHIFEYCSVIQATKRNEGQFEIQVYNTKLKAFSHLYGSKLVLATGGLGMLYAKTTNQSIATGDGLYIANKMGAAIENLSYIQFHPTGLFQEGNISFLISEALRGAGAILRNEFGEAFMGKYDKRLDLAPRDIVSRAITQEIENQQLEFVYLDATNIEATILSTHFPTIKEACLHRLKINIEKDWIPVVPVQHYSCGGVQVDEYGETCIPNLFAIGEIASTGLHGANRLASNSLLEAIAFAKFSSLKLVEKRTSKKSLLNDQLTVPTTMHIERAVLQNIMSKNAGIVKTNTGIKDAMDQLLLIKNSRIVDSSFNYKHFETQCMLEVAILLIKDAQNQKENKGVFYNSNLVSLDN